MADGEYGVNEWCGCSSGCCNVYYMVDVVMTVYIN